MLSPTTTTTTTTTSAAATTTAAYTTIPISGDDVISRSIQNLSDTVSRHRPWSEFIAAGVFDCPESLSAAGLRLQKNSKYFSINYAILISICAAFSILLTPISLIAYAAVFALWLVLVFFREDPMVAWGYHVSDRIVIGGLVLVSAMAIWFAGMVNYLLIGVAVGLLISAVHGALRNPDGLFLDEDDAVSDGLIANVRAWFWPSIIVLILIQILQTSRSPNAKLHVEKVGKALIARGRALFLDEENHIIGLQLD